MSEKEFRGGCLCGAVRFVVSGEVARFTHCHCSRCRRATGTGHATNLIVKPAHVTWERGEEQVRRYKLPDAERFSTAFCSECGSPLPRVIPQMGFALIPAGALDGDPGLRPQSHIFWDSRADWSCPADGLPTFSEYPAQG